MLWVNTSSLIPAPHFLPTPDMTGGIFAWTKCIWIKKRCQPAADGFPLWVRFCSRFIPVSQEVFPCHCCPRLTRWGPVLCKAALWLSPYKSAIQIHWIELKNALVASGSLSTPLLPRGSSVHHNEVPKQWGAKAMRCKSNEVHLIALAPHAWHLIALHLIAFAPHCFCTSLLCTSWLWHLMLWHLIALAPHCLHLVALAPHGFGTSLLWHLIALHSLLLQSHEVAKQYALWFPCFSFGTSFSWQ